MPRIPIETVGILNNCKSHGKKACYSSLRTWIFRGDVG